MRSWTKFPARRYLGMGLKTDEQDEIYGKPCICCESHQTYIIGKRSRLGLQIICRECGAIYYMPEVRK